MLEELMKNYKLVPYVVTMLKGYNRIRTWHIYDAIEDKVYTNTSNKKLTRLIYKKKFKQDQEEVLHSGPADYGTISCNKFKYNNENYLCKYGYGLIKSISYDNNVIDGVELISDKVGMEYTYRLDVAGGVEDRKAI